MSKKKRKVPKSIFIACEGRNTEPIYFERIKELIEEDNELLITIYPDQSDCAPTTHALGLVKEAQSQMNDFDEVWAVFDKDGYTKHQETFELANQEINGKKVNIAFSSISFEHWVLLHFEKSRVAFEKSINIIDHLRDRQYFPDYEKKTYIDTFSALKDKTETAIINSAWLKYQLTLTNELPAPLYEVNPYTDVEILVKRLLKIDYDVLWASPGEKVQAKDITLAAQADDEHVRIHIHNRSTTALIFNAANQAAYFHLYNPAGELIATTISKAVFVAPAAEDSVQLLIGSKAKGHQLICNIDRLRVFVDL